MCAAQKQINEGGPASDVNADLLAACKAALKRCEDAKARFVGRFVGDDELMERLSAAIAKAEGRLFRRGDTDAAVIPARAMAAQSHEEPERWDGCG